MWKVLFLSGFFARNSNKLQDLGLDGKICCTLNMFTLLIFYIKSIVKMWKIKIVFTLEQMAQATLVSLIFTNKEKGQNTRIIKKNCLYFICFECKYHRTF
jgi:hypothetical protein